MTFVLLKNYGHYVIVNDDADRIVGDVLPLNGWNGPYKVRAHVGPIYRETTEAGIVNSLDDAIPAFLAYYEKFPLLWDGVNKTYWRDTLHAFLRVQQHQQ